MIPRGSYFHLKVPTELSLPDADFLVTRSLMPFHKMLMDADVVGYPASPVHGFPASAEECARRGEMQGIGGEQMRLLVGGL